MGETQRPYDPIRDLGDRKNELIHRRNSRIMIIINLFYFKNYFFFYRQTMTLDETKDLLKDVENTVEIAIGCASKGMYYRHWRGFIYYINGVFDTIDSLLQHPEYEIELKLKTKNL